MAQQQTKKMPIKGTDRQDHRKAEQQVNIDELLAPRAMPYQQQQGSFLGAPETVWQNYLGLFQLASYGHDPKSAQVLAGSYIGQLGNDHPLYEMMDVLARAHGDLLDIQDKYEGMVGYN